MKSTFENRVRYVSIDFVIIFLALTLFDILIFGSVNVLSNSILSLVYSIIFSIIFVKKTPKGKDKL